MLSTMRASGLLTKCLNPSFKYGFSAQATVNANFLKFRRGYDESVKLF